MYRVPLPFRPNLSAQSEGNDSEQSSVSTSDHNKNLPYFLSVLQHLGVDILPITWQPALDELGRGKFTLVNQSLINIQMSLAFKRSGANSMYENLISEVAILSIPNIREHPNVNPLVGVCWEVMISRTALPDVRPVLVFPKAQKGSLKTFMAGEEGRKLELHQMHHICLEIAQGLEALHACNVIHGDVKPDNVLVFDNPSGGISVKVIDFGYSSTWATPEDFIRVPTTRPWTAPEWHLRGFRVGAARKMDVYSYGLLCLWLLLHNDKTFEPSGEIRQLLFAKGSEWATGKVEEFTAGTSYMEALDHEICYSGSSDPRTLSAFRAVLKTTLQRDANKRDDDLQNSIRILDHPEGFSELLREGSANMEVPLSLPSHTVLDLTDLRFLLQLSASDFEARAALARSLGSLANNLVKGSRCENCSTLATFQLAIIRSIGMGSAMNQKSARIKIEQKEIDIDELKMAIQKIKGAPARNRPLHRSNLYNELNFRGHIHLKDSDFRSLYTADLAKQVDREWSLEVETVTKTLGETHQIVLVLKRAFALFLKYRGRHTEALKLFQGILKTKSEQLGEQHHDSLTAMEDLGHTLSLLGHSTEAANMAERSSLLHQKHFGDNHAATQMAIVSLAQRRLLQGRFEEATVLLEKAFRSIELTFGKSHPYVCTVLGDLAHTYRDSGKWEEAASLERDALARSIDSLGNSHSLTLKSKGNLAATLGYQGLHDEAERLQEEVVDQFSVMLGENHPDTIEARNELAITYRYQGRLGDAERILSNCIEGALIRWEPEHPHILRMMSTLASVKVDRGYLDEAVELEETVYEKMKVSNGEAHPDTLMALSNLANTYSELGRFENAESLETRNLDLKTTNLGAAHPETLLTKGNLAVTYSRQSRFKEAEALQSQVATEREKLLGPSHPDTLTAHANVATIMHKNGEFKDALEIMEKVLEGRKRALGSAHSDVINSMGDIAAIYSSLGRIKEAEEMEVEVLRTRQASLGDSHPHTFTAMQNLASTFMQNQRWEDAEKLLQDEVRIRREQARREDRDLLDALSNLALVKGRRGSWESARGLLVEAYEGRRVLLGELDPSTVRSKLMLDHVSSQVEGSKED